MKHLMRSFKRLSRITCIALVAVHVLTTVKAMEPTGVPPSTSTRVPSLRQMAEVSILNDPETTVDQTNSTNHVPSLRVMAKCAIREMILEKRMLQKITEEVAKQLIPPLVCSASDLAFASTPMRLAEFNSLPDLPHDEFPADWNKKEVEQFEIQELIDDDRVIAIKKGSRRLCKLERNEEPVQLHYGQVIDYRSLGKCKDFRWGIIEYRYNAGSHDYHDYHLFEYNLADHTHGYCTTTNERLPYGLSEDHNIIIEQKQGIDFLQLYNSQLGKVLLIVPDFGYMIVDKQVVLYDFEHAEERGYALQFDVPKLLNKIRTHAYRAQFLPLLFQASMNLDDNGKKTLKRRVKEKIAQLDQIRNRSNPTDESEIEKTVATMVYRGILNKLDPILWPDHHPT